MLTARSDLFTEMNDSFTTTRTNYISKTQIEKMAHLSLCGQHLLFWGPGIGYLTVAEAQLRRQRHHFSANGDNAT